ncbi:hypothetical protein AJ87_05880 [Rhizobium yanglingense]|nr:hypothetical protein AJ87_05880 [Rhizobium yanglingense]
MLLEEGVLAKRWQLDYDLPVFDIKQVNGSGVYTYGRFAAVEYRNGTTYYSIGKLEDGYCQNVTSDLHGFWAAFHNGRWRQAKARVSVESAR